MFRIQPQNFIMLHPNIFTKKEIHSRKVTYYKKKIEVDFVHVSLLSILGI